MVCSKKVIFVKKFCPWQRSCSGQVASSNFVLLETVLPKAAKLLRTSGFFKNNQISGKICPRQRSCPGQVASSKKKSIFCQKFCPRQRSCPGHVASSKSRLSGKSSAPGSEAARDKWFLQKSKFSRKNLPQAAKLPGTSGFFKRIDFWKKLLPQDGEAARDKWLLQTK